MGFHTSFGGSLGADVPIAGIGKAADLAPHVTLSGEKKTFMPPNWSKHFLVQLHAKLPLENII